MYTGSMNFGLGEDIDALREMTHRFAQEKVAPLAPQTLMKATSFPPISGRRWGLLACSA